MSTLDTLITPEMTTRQVHAAIRAAITPTAFRAFMARQEPSERRNAIWQYACFGAKFICEMVGVDVATNDYTGCQTNYQKNTSLYVSREVGVWDREIYIKQFGTINPPRWWCWWQNEMIIYVRRMGHGPSGNYYWPTASETAHLFEKSLRIVPAADWMKSSGDGDTWIAQCFTPMTEVTMHGKITFIAPQREEAP